jgi:hypothetical protein
MKRLPLSIILLILFLSFFFNLERLDFGAQDLININTFVYIIETVAIVFTIMIRNFEDCDFLHFYSSGC